MNNRELLAYEKRKADAVKTAERWTTKDRVTTSLSVFAVVLSLITAYYGSIRLVDEVRVGKGKSKEASMFIRVLAIGTACIFIAATPIWSAQKAIGGDTGDIKGKSAASSAPRSQAPWSAA